MPAVSISCSSTGSDFPSYDVLLIPSIVPALLFDKVIISPGSELVLALSTDSPSNRKYFCVLSMNP